MSNISEQREPSHIGLFNWIFQTAPPRVYFLLNLLAFRLRLHPHGIRSARTEDTIFYKGGLLIF